MDFWETIKNRKSVRSFDPRKEITDEEIRKIIEAGKRAPSAGGIYPVEFIVVREIKTKEKLAKAARRQNFISQVPVVIVVVVDVEKTASKYGERGRKLYVIQDGAAATQNMLLAITALGLESCWVGAFEEEEVKEVLGLESHVRPQAIIPVG